MPCLTRSWSCEHIYVPTLWSTTWDSCVWRYYAWVSQGSTYVIHSNSAVYPTNQWKHEERILLRQPESRALLKYAGVSRDRRYEIQSLEPVPRWGLRHVEKDGFHSLVELLNRLTEETESLTCPEPYGEYLSECAIPQLVAFFKWVATKMQKKHYRSLQGMKSTFEIPATTINYLLYKVVHHHHRLCVQMPFRCSQQAPWRCLPHS